VPALVPCRSALFAVLLRSTALRRGICPAARRAVTSAAESADQASSSTGPGSSDAEIGAPGVGADGEDAFGELVPSVRVYRRSRAEHQRIFRWGVGNAFRMQSQNRFTPVHKPHPKEVCVRDDYYATENPNIVWEELNEVWEVYWYENSKLNARPFPVKKFGVERAKREAYAWYEELRDAGRLKTKKHIPSPQPGVFYDARMQDWVCFFWRDNRPLSRCFSANKFGFDGAQKLAVAKQNDPVNGVLPLRKGKPLLKPFRKAVQTV